MLRNDELKIIVAQIKTPICGSMVCLQIYKSVNQCIQSFVQKLAGELYKRVSRDANAKCFRWRAAYPRLESSTFQ